MKKELVAVKDIYGYWSNIMCITCSEKKQLDSFDKIVENVKKCLPELKNGTFVQENEEIYVFVNDLIQINPGDKCK